MKGSHGESKSRNCHAVTILNQGEITIIGQQDTQFAGKGYLNETNCNKNEIQGQHWRLLIC